VDLSERIKYLREQRGWSQEKLATRAKKPRSNIASLESRGSKRASIDMLLAVARAFDMSIEELMGDEKPIEKPESIESLWERLQAMQPVSVPVKGVIPCGTPEVKEETIEGYIYVPRDLLRGKKGVYALKVSGQSLIGDQICPGDYLIVEPHAQIIDGRIYVLRLDNEVVARHVYRQNGKYKLMASNGDYRDIEPEQLEVLGRVIVAGHWNEL